MDTILSSLFILEATLKIITFGFMFWGKNSYIRNGWNIIDFTIVWFSLISFTTGSDVRAFKAIRLLRVLRPLRVISRNQGLKVAVQALLMAIPNIGNVLIISLLFFMIFGIICVNFLKGQFYLWYNYNTDEYETIINSLNGNPIKDEYDWANNGSVWIRYDAHFDNIFNAILALFEMSTTENWADYMYLAASTKGIGVQPERENKAWVPIFFIIFILFGSFFVLNLFVGVVIGTFNSEKDNIGKNFLLTNTQKEWIEIKLLILSAKPKESKEYQEKSHKNKIRKFLFRIVSHEYFELFIMTWIILNTLVLCINWYDQPSKVTQSTEILNYVFFGVFFVEATVKIIALGWRGYFKDTWNRFDFAIVVGTTIFIFLLITVGIDVGPQTTLVRAFRISRILRLVKRAKSLKIIFETFIITIPALVNVGGLLLLFLYLYSILGVSLFADVKLQSNYDGNANFKTFWRAFLTLLRWSTGEAWNSIMYDLARQNGPLFQCIYNPTYQDYVDNGRETIGWGSFGSILYFSSFILVVTLIFLNLFIAIILQGFNSTNQKSNLILDESHLEDFVDKWAQYDPQATGYILMEDFRILIEHLKDPLGLPKKTSEEDKLLFIDSLQLATFGSLSKYNFYDVLNNISRELLVKSKLSSKKSLTLDFSAREERIQKLLEELAFKGHKHEIEAVVELHKKSVKLTSKFFKNKDTFSTTLLKVVLKFKRILKRIRERKKNNGKSPTKLISNLLGDTLNDEKQLPKSLKDSSFVTSSIDSDSDSNSNESNEWRRQRSMPTADIIIKPPTYREKPKNIPNFKLIDYDKVLSVIEENSVQNSKGSKNESSMSCVFPKRFSKDADTSSKNKLPELTPGSKMNNVWNTDKNIDGNMNLHDENNSDFAEEIKKRDFQELQQNDDAIKAFDQEDAEGDITNLSPIEKMLDIQHNDSVTTLLLENMKEFKPNQTFNYSRRSNINQVEKKLVIKGTNKEIMGNSWINWADTDKITTLKREKSKLDIAELEREIADLEAPLSVIEERPKDSTTNVGSSEFKHGLISYKDRNKYRSELESHISNHSKNGESSFIGNHSISSLAKPWLNSPGSLSISDISEIQREHNL